MNRIAIAFSSKDRPELTRRTIEPLLQPDKFDLLWMDGSKTDEGLKFFQGFDSTGVTKVGMYGGSCRYIVAALTQMLANPGYDYVGLVENDVLLDPDWFEPTMALFGSGDAAGLCVGAVSARNYEDRVLIQRDGCSINHNLGAGQIIFTREAAELILQQYRTGMSSENRRVFSIVSGVDIAGFWAFRGSDHMLTADWAWEQQLLKQGLCSLALMPAKAEQLEDIARMGLAMVREPVEVRRDQRTFETFRDRTHAIRNGELIIPHLPNDHLYHSDGTGPTVHTIFPHQLPQIGGRYWGDWRFKWSIGYGCFSWLAGEEQPCDVGVHYPTVTVPLLGACDLLVSGGKTGGKVHVRDAHGYESSPELFPEGDEGKVFGLTLPSAAGYREVTLTALTPGVIFYGVRARTPQPFVPSRFDFSVLPPL